MVVVVIAVADAAVVVFVAAVVAVNVCNSYCWLICCFTFISIFNMKRCRALSNVCNKRHWLVCVERLD